jgi:hypothetical protein
MNVRPNVGPGMNVSPNCLTRMVVDKHWLQGTRWVRYAEKQSKMNGAVIITNCEYHPRMNPLRTRYCYGQVCSSYIGRLSYAATQHYGIADSEIVNCQSTQLHTTKGCLAPYESTPSTSLTQLLFGLQAAPRQSRYLPLSWYDFIGGGPRLLVLSIRYLLLTVRIEPSILVLCCQSCIMNLRRGAPGLQRDAVHILSMTN